MLLGSQIGPAGEVTNRVIKAGPRDPINVMEIPRWLDGIRSHVRALGGHVDNAMNNGVYESLLLAKPSPNYDFADNSWLNDNFPNLWHGLKRALISNALQLSSLMGTLYLKHRKHVITDGAFDRYKVGPMLLASYRVVTTVGVNAITDAFDAGVGFTLSDFNFHAIGVGGGSELIGDTALVTEFTTQYGVDNTRATGVQTQPSANVYQTVGTNTSDDVSTQAVTEHGILTQAATGGGSLLDRSVFSAKNLDQDDQLESTYQFTTNAGS